MKRLTGMLLITGIIYAGVVFSGIAGAAEAVDGKALFAQKCANCHGAAGVGGGAPMLKGKKADDVAAALKGYKDGTYGGARKNVMKGVADGLKPEEASAIGAFIGTL